MYLYSVFTLDYNTIFNQNRILDFKSQYFHTKEKTNINLDKYFFLKLVELGFHQRNERLHSWECEW